MIKSNTFFIMKRGKFHIRSQLLYLINIHVLVGFNLFGTLRVFHQYNKPNMLGIWKIYKTRTCVKRRSCTKKVHYINNGKNQHHDVQKLFTFAQFLFFLKGLFVVYRHRLTRSHFLYSILKHAM